MKKLNLIDIAQVSGGASLYIYKDVVEIKHLQYGEILTFSNLQFTNRGYFDLQGKHLDAITLDYTNIHDGYKIAVDGLGDHKWYRLPSQDNLKKLPLYTNEKGQAFKWKLLI